VLHERQNAAQNLTYRYAMGQTETGRSAFRDRPVRPLRHLSV